MVHTLHGVPERIALELGSQASVQTGMRDRGRLRAEALLARLGTVVIPSHALADLVVRRGFPADRIRVIPSGVTVQRTTPAPLRRPAVLGTAATLDHHKGVDVLLEACAVLAAPVTVEIFGDGSAREQLEKLAARLGVPATFHGYVDDYRSRIAALDLFVLPTRGDNLPVAILEAMASAVPVVATRVGGIPELIVDGESGILVPPDDSAALARACERLLASDELRTSLAEGGVRRVEERFTLADVARRIVACTRSPRGREWRSAGRRAPSHACHPDLTFGGAERIVATLSKRLEDSGAHVSVVSSGSALPGLPNVRVAPLPRIERRIHRLPAAALALRRALRQERPAVVHAHNPGMALVTAAATARGRVTPALVTVHGVPEEDYGSAARVLRIAGLPIVACGPGVAAALEDHGVLVAGTVVNGVQPVNGSTNGDALKQSFGLSPELRLVVAVGRLVPQKNHALALRAVAGVPAVALVVVGEGPYVTSSTLTRSLGLDGRVRFTGARSDARRLTAAADAFLLSSRWEGLPLVVLEALAAGTPVVATAARGVRELVADGDTAVLAPPDDADALAEGLRRVLEDDTLSARLRANGLRLAERYSEERMTERYLALYRSLARS